MGRDATGVLSGFIPECGEVAGSFRPDAQGRGAMHRLGKAVDSPGPEKGQTGGHHSRGEAGRGSDLDRWTRGSAHAGRAGLGCSASERLARTTPRCPLVRPRLLPDPRESRERSAPGHRVRHEPAASAGSGGGSCRDREVGGRQANDRLLSSHGLPLAGGNRSILVERVCSTGLGRPSLLARPSSPTTTGGVYHASMAISNRTPNFGLDRRSGQGTTDAHRVLG